MAKRKRPAKTAATKIERPAIPAEAGPPDSNPFEDARKAGMSGGPVNDEEKVTPLTAKERQALLSPKDKQMVIVEVPFQMAFNNRVFAPGSHRVPAHVASQLKHMIYKKKKSEEDVEKQKEVKLITPDDAEELVKKELLDLNVLEYIDEDIDKGVRNEGSDTKDAIYLRKLRGHFDKQIISILVNLKTKQIHRKFYDDSKINDENMSL